MRVSANDQTMTNNVLYYPYIRVPQNAWFLRVLLYWDSVGSIVPYSYLHNPQKLGKYMRELVAEGLVKQIIPSDHIHKIPHFSEVFIDTATQYKSKLERNNMALDDLPTSRIHIDKLDSIGDELCDMKLAKLDKYPWFLVKSDLANMFMAYLAGTLSCLPEIKSRPITDTIQQLNIYHTLRTDRNIILDKLLPSPQRNLTALEIAQFKSKNQKYLAKFRNKIELFIIEASAITNEEMRKEMVGRFISGSKDDIDNIVSAMESQGWVDIIFGSLLSYGGAGLTYLEAIKSANLLGAIAAAFGVGMAINTTFQEIRSTRLLGDSYFAYAFLAGSKL